MPGTTLDVVLGSQTHLCLTVIFMSACPYWQDLLPFPKDAGV